jgi:predicted amidohydrolase YtcJ
VSAELVLRGRIRTLDPARPAAWAVAVAGGVITGLDGEAVDSVGPGTEVLEVGAGLVLPAFRDGHAHPVWAGLELAEAPIAHARSVAEVVEAVRAHAAANPGLEWIRGGSYDPTLAPGGLFDARWLDAAVPDRPIYLESADHHSAWVNTAAMRAAGLDADTPEPASSRLPRREEGQLLGTLVEWGAMDLIRRVLPARTSAERLAAAATGSQRLARQGIAWTLDAACSPADVEAYRAADGAGLLATRVECALRADPGRWSEQVGSFLAERAAAAGRVRAGTVKFFADGVVEFATAAMLDPYADSPHDCGLAVWEPAELAEAVAAFDAAGFGIHIHAIGDGGIRQALDALAGARDRGQPGRTRPTLAHVQVLDPMDLPRFAALGVVANAEPLWSCLDVCQRDLTAPRLGPVRSARQYPWASLLGSGAAVSMGSDWPVSSERPLEGLAVAVTRQTPDGVPAQGWLPAERLTVDQAVAAYTRGTAYQAGEEGHRGVLAPGYAADLVWLSRDLWETPPLEWPAVEVLGTWVDGARSWG